MINVSSTIKYNNVILFTNGAIGDFLMAGLCVFKAKEKIPGSRLIILTPRNAVILGDLFSAYPDARVYEINRRHFLQALIFLIRTMWQKNMVINQGVFKKIPFLLQLFTRLLTINKGSVYLHFSQKGGWRKQKGRGIVVFDYHLLVYENLAQLFNTQNLGVSSDVPLYHLKYDADILNRYGLVYYSYIIIHPSAFNPARSLPRDRWLKIFTYLSDNFPNIKIVITGSKQDDLFIQKIFGTGVLAPSIVNLAGKLSMTELANIINGAKGYLGVDTGITHLAGVLQKTSVVIGNLSNPCWLPRYNKKAIILTDSKNCTCDGQKGGDCFYHIGKEKYYKCMLDIPEEVIYESLKKILI